MDITTKSQSKHKTLSNLEKLMFNKCLKPLSTIFQLFRGGKFCWWRKLDNRPVASHWQTLSHNVVSSAPRHEPVRTHKFSGERNWLHM